MFEFSGIGRLILLSCFAGMSLVASKTKMVLVVMPSNIIVLNSDEYEIYLVNLKMPNFVGMLIFTRRINFMLIPYSTGIKVNIVGIFIFCS